MADLPSLEGPVERLNGELALRIRLETRGKNFIDCAKDIGHGDGDFFVVVIQQGLADKLRIGGETPVVADNGDGNFNLTWSPASDEPDTEDAVYRRAAPDTPRESWRAQGCRGNLCCGRDACRARRGVASLPDEPCS